VARAGRDKAHRPGVFPAAWQRDVARRALAAVKPSARRAAAGLALATAFLLVWANGAVGLVGDERHPANAMVAGVLAVAIVGAVIARMRPRGMARAMVATALAQALVALVALVAAWGNAWLPSAFFIALWLASAALFRSAAVHANHD
jgi:hypothetical protein